MKNAGNDRSAINVGVPTRSMNPPRRHAASMPRNVPTTNEIRKAIPTRKIDHGSVFRTTSVTGTWLAVETPRSPVNVFFR